MEATIDKLIKNSIKKYSDKNIGEVLEKLNEYHNIDVFRKSDTVNVKYDIINNREDMVIYFEIPGVDRKSLQISVINNKIILKGNKKKPYKKDAIKNEITYGKFERKVILPMIISDQNYVKTDFEDGILTLKINKKYVKDHSFTINF